MNAALKELIGIIIAYFVVYIALWGLETWWKKRLFKRYYKHYNCNNTSSGMSVDEACKILGISKSEFNKMTKNDLKKAYWKKAKEVHPDKPNGNEEMFKNVKNAYDFAYAQAA